MRHRVARIHHEVHEHLLELAGVGAHRVDVRGRLSRQLDILADQPAQHLADVLHQAVHVEDHRLQGLSRAEGEQLADEVLSVRRCLPDDLELLAVGGAGRCVQNHQLGRAEDGREHVVEIMGHAPGETAHDHGGP